MKYPFHFCQALKFWMVFFCILVGHLGRTWCLSVWSCEARGDIQIHTCMSLLAQNHFLSCYKLMLLLVMFGLIFGSSCFSRLYYEYWGFADVEMVIQHVLRWQLPLRWYLQRQRVRARVIIWLLVQGNVRIRVRVMVKVGVRFNISICHRNNCH